MPLPDLHTFCIKLFPGGQLCVQFPGGAKVCASFPDGKIPTADELTGALIGEVNAALAPLMPIFRILDVLVAMVDCIKAVEKCLGPPPNPTELVKCFPKLARAMAEVLKLLPMLSIPVLIGGILDVLIMNLQGVRACILAFLMKQLRIVAANTYARQLGSIQLQVAVDCATDDLNAAIVNLNAKAGALATLVAVLNALLDLAGLPELPLSVGALGADANASLAPLDESIRLLQTLRAGFP
jgi:hypothetical protein